MSLLKRDFRFEGINYVAYSNGDIYGPSGKKLKARKNGDGYLEVTLGSRHVRRIPKAVHRIVAELFIPNPNGYSDVDHKDGKRDNPDMNNLRWVSHQKNVHLAHQKGSYKGRVTGVKNPRASMDDATVLELRAKSNAGYTVQQLVKEYGFPWSTINHIVKEETWKHLLP